MNIRAKHVLVTILAQAGCLAVGLWMQYQFLESSVASEGLNAAWTDVEREAERVLSQRAIKAGSASSGDLLASDETFVLSVVRDRDVLVTIVDDQWRVLRSTYRTERQDVMAAGAATGWNKAAPPDAGDQRRLRGTLDMPDGVHLAVALPFGNGVGHLMLHRPAAVAESRALELLAKVPALSALTFLWTWALLGVLAYMLLAKFHDAAERDRARSIAEGLRQRQDLVRTRDAVVFGLAKLADSRDPDTGDHLERISVYSTLLASILRRHPKYAREVTPAFVRLIGISSALHDIGKVGVEDNILLKPGSLTSDERSRMQFHPTIGGNCLREIEQRLGSSNFLQMAREIAYAHHERWDGTGYPNGLNGEEIPLAARVIAIADVYDALASRRVYKKARAHEECVEVICEAAGTQFDPDLVSAWLTIAPKFAEVARRYSGRPAPEESPGPAGAGASHETRKRGSERDGVEAEALLAVAPQNSA